MNTRARAGKAPSFLFDYAQAMSRAIITGEQPSSLQVSFACSLFGAQADRASGEMRMLMAMVAVLLLLPLLLLRRRRT